MSVRVTLELLHLLCMLRGRYCNANWKSALSCRILPPSSRWYSPATVIRKTILRTQTHTDTQAHELNFTLYDKKIRPVFSVMYMIYLLTAIGLSPGGSSTVHIYTRTIRRTTQNKQCIEQHNNLGETHQFGRVSCGSLSPLFYRYDIWSLLTTI